MELALIKLLGPEVRPDGDRFPEVGYHVLRQPHFGEGKQKGQRGFRALISIHPIHMQSVSAAAAVGRIQLQSEVVPPDKPIEGTSCLLVPPGVGCGAIRLQAGRDHGLRLDWLLVEICPRASSSVKAIAADRAEMTFLR